MHTPHQIRRQVTPKTQLLIALALTTVLAFSAGLASGLYGRAMYAFLTISRAEAAPAAPVTAANQAAPLGIDLPYGADIRELPQGLSDYIRRGNTTSTIGMHSYPLGIDLPYGADIRTLPRGLTDYLRPQAEKPPTAAPSTALGITMPTGAKYSDLPRGMADYLRSSQ
jgi:hypothetical protein